MGSEVPPKIYEILRKVTHGDIENFNIIIHDPNKKGDGYLGQMFFVSLQDKSEGKQINFVVKQAFSDQNIREHHPIADAFFNEIYFYQKVWPVLQKFQEKVAPIYRFDNLPKYFGAISEDNFERLVLDNLKYHGFVMHDKKIPLDKDMFEFIFKVYGKFHAVSFAYEYFHPQEFSELTKELIDVWDTYSNKNSFRSAIEITHEQSFDIIQSEVENVVIEKYKRYVKDGVQLFRKSLINNKYSVITHGDCWSNNMMFKYNVSGKLIDLKFLDFQITKLGSPVCDLSYCLYSGGTKQVFDDLNHLLQIYHDSLSQSLRAYECDPNQVYPLKKLKGDWKLYCQLGATMGLMIWRSKLTYADDVVDLTDITDNDDGIQKFFDTKFDKEAFKERTRDIILHLYENNFLF